MADMETARASSAGAEDHRVISRLDLKTGPTGQGDGRGRHVGIAIDVETTGLDAGSGAIIELAVRRFRYDADGVITDVDQPYAWVEDPGRPISAEITALTGLSDADVEGRFIDEDAAERLLNSASFVVAHNSAFDRVWVENRLEGARGLNWVCSMAQVDWRARGFDGRTLGFLLMQAGYFHGGHRADADVDALIQLLRHRFDDGRTALSVLLDRGSRPSWLFRARGADFSVKDLLRERGYRWNAERKMWCREVADEDRMEEEFWLAGHVYDFAARPKALGPDVERVTARSRFLP
ncbi:3'-5' exonuclease [Sphingomonas albertensis]|uniref:DNA polymerase III subunit epsilon n=1 Tax=Sphingomonas albertensis TaxID=2762591 RepID=A0ABR7AJW3_9SPHN|nr:3'-5' exonuclease [Sphingomonas albertensis]MBC3940607.1 DNA polymerase III subunit epsilon [Sphingomonas albertensis]